MVVHYIFDWLVSIRWSSCWRPAHLMAEAVRINRHNMTSPNASYDMSDMSPRHRLTSWPGPASATPRRITTAIPVSGRGSIAVLSMPSGRGSNQIASHEADTEYHILYTDATGIIIMYIQLLNCVNLSIFLRISERQIVEAGPLEDLFIVTYLPFVKVCCP